MQVRVLSTEEAAESPRRERVCHIVEHCGSRENSGKVVGDNAGEVGQAMDAEGLCRYRNYWQGLRFMCLNNHWGGN